MRGLKSPYKRKRGQMGGIVFVGDPKPTEPSHSRFAWDSNQVEVHKKGGTSE